MDLKDLLSYGIIIVAIAIVLGFGSQILYDMGKTVRVSTVTTSTNDSITPVNNTYVEFTASAGSIDSVTLCRNPYNGTIGTGNYTVNAASGTLNVTVQSLNDHTLLSATSGTDEWNCTYLYTRYLNAAYNSTQAGQRATNTFADWLDNIALIIVAAIIIGIIIGSFMIYRATR